MGYPRSTMHISKAIQKECSFKQGLNKALLASSLGSLWFCAVVFLGMKHDFV